ncbi:MAG TPA: cytochrome b/b6 domain-containing protein [Anaeromyxobacteraceae bacterium]|nr:cytochrome b/b6 domain-containing protein [Anaeromyxobacteraceae bacterium]
MKRQDLVTLLAAFALAVSAAPAGAQQGVNPIHPAFVPLDAAGQAARSGAEVSADRTCGGCHDAAYVSSHSGHADARVKASCVQCHVDGGRLDVRPEVLERDGRLRREAIRIGTPRAANCGACHGLVTGSADPVALPADFEAAPGTAGGRTWSLTMGEGAIVSPQRMADSFLNLAGKAELAAPWDVHAAKLVDCVACHYAGNNPARTDAKRATLQYLSADPRRQSTAEFLVRPDHRLAEQGCRGCHDPLRAHQFLPYRQRHMAALACQSCHAEGAMAPAAEMVDATVVTPEGTPAVRYRNVDRRPGEALNGATVRPLRPLLVERTEPDGVRRLAPVNPVGRWRWVSGVDRAEVPFDRVAQVFLEAGGYAPAVVEALDANRDGRLDPVELRLDTRAKADLIANRLRALGVVDPVIDGTLDVHPLAHGVSTRDRALRDCDACHAKDSRLSEDGYLVASYLPGGTPPRPNEKARVELAGLLAPTPGGGLAFRADAGTAPAGLHVLGHSRQGLTNTLGFALFLAVFAGVALHGLARVVLRRRRAGTASHAPAEKQYVFGRYERLWHWTMALSGVVLIVTGLEVHGGGLRLLDLPTAVAVHNAFALVLVVNGVLALFYHLATAAIRNFIPHPHGFLERVLAHMSYQARGIFYGESHPPNAPGHKLNPLQQITYLALLNVLFPLQFVTGALIWAVGQWPEAASALHGLGVVAPVHNAGAWLFLSFFVLHAYLVTTGRTPADHLRSMITGYGHLEAEEQTP